MAPKADSQLMDIRGKAYLKVPGRVDLFRAEHPLGVITTEIVYLEPRIVVRAHVHAADGTMISSGYGTAPMIGKGESTWRDKEIEKAETAAVGRALGFAGYGTLAAFEDDDRDNLADAPIERPTPPPSKPAPAPTASPFADLAQVEPPTNGDKKPPVKPWTIALGNDFNVYCTNLGLTTPQVTAILGVERISEYKPGFDAAIKAIDAHMAKAGAK